jgi:HEAT repeat protein
VGVLAEELRSGAPADRVRAAIALGETRTIAALEALTLALEDEDPTVRIRAREAVEKIRETPVF